MICGQKSDNPCFVLLLQRVSIVPLLMWIPTDKNASCLSCPSWLDQRRVIHGNSVEARTFTRNGSIGDMSGETFPTLIDT